MRTSKRMRSYQPHLGDGLHSVYQPRAIKHHRYGISLWAVAAIAFASMPVLYLVARYGAPLFLTVLAALAHGGQR